MPLLQGLGYLEAFYRIIEKRNEFDLTRNLGVRREEGTFAILHWCEMLLQLFLCVLWCRCTSCDFSVLSLTSRRGVTGALCQSDD